VPVWTGTRPGLLVPLLSATADQCARALGPSSGPWGCGLSRTALSAACRSRCCSIRSRSREGRGAPAPRLWPGGGVSGTGRPEIDKPYTFPLCNQLKWRTDRHLMSRGSRVSTTPEGLRTRPPDPRWPGEATQIPRDYRANGGEYRLIDWQQGSCSQHHRESYLPRERRPFFSGVNPRQPTPRGSRRLRDTDVGKPRDYFRPLFSGQLNSASRTWRPDGRSQASAARNSPRPALGR
jgi:hypothetical protein